MWHLKPSVRTARRAASPGSPAGEGILDPGEMMTMAMIDRSRAVKAASAAAVAAPYVRRLMRDDRLRNELRTLISSANHLYSELSSGDTVDTLLRDASIRKDVDHMLAAMQHAGQRAIKDRNSGPNWFIIALVSGLAGAIGALLVYPRTRHGIQSAAGNLRHGGLHAVEDVQDTVEKAA